MESTLRNRLSQKSKDRIQQIRQQYSGSSREHTPVDSEVIECPEKSTEYEIVGADNNSTNTIDSAITLEEFKAQVDAALREYFVSDNVMEILYCIEELDAPLYGYVVVMRSVSLAVDRGPKEKELVSRLFAVGYGFVLSSFAMTKGFEKLFERISDLQLDCPDIKSDLSKFLARAITDEVVPPSILNDFILKEYGSDVLTETENLLNVPHSIELMEHVWGAGIAVLEDIKVTRNLLKDAIMEFYDSHDVDECLRCVYELDAPYYMHEFVKKAVEVAMDDETKRLPLCIQLIEKAAQTVVPHHQLVVGLKRLQKGMEELRLDVPRADAILAKICDDLQKAQLVTEEELVVWTVCNKQGNSIVRA